jgi:predicted nucleic acid-binding protein
VSQSVQAHKPVGEQEWVADASVGIQLLINGPLSDVAYSYFAQLTAEPPVRIHVPDLFYIEITNALWKYVRWQGLAVEEAQAYLHQLGRLDLEITPSSHLMVDALTQAALYNISAYDGCYLALAQRLAVPLLTADAKLAKSVQNAHIVRLLT